jgi:transposase
MPLENITNKPPVTRKQLSDEFYGIIIGRFEAGQTVATISKQMKLPNSTVRDAVQRWKTFGTAVPAKRTGRPEKLNREKKNHLRLSIRRAPFEPYGRHLANMNAAGIDICRTTLIKYIRELGFGSYTPAFKPRLTKVHIQKRLAWARDKVKLTTEEWSRIIWSDESRFTVVGNDGGARVLRQEGERYQTRHIKSTVKFGKGSVMVWGCFWAGGLGPLVVVEETMNQDSYVKILADHFLPWLEELTSTEGEEFTFQEDGASCHTGSYATWYKNRCQIKQFDYWPAQSPDLNPIEHLWSYLEKRIEARRHQIENVDQLKAILQEEWRRIDANYLSVLALSMPRRCQAVIDSHGEHTKY